MLRASLCWCRLLSDKTRPADIVNDPNHNCLYVISVSHIIIKVSSKLVDKVPHACRATAYVHSNNLRSSSRDLA
jgi:hypothetical protein